MKDLKLGVAYHSNRLFSHVEADMKELVERLLDEQYLKNHPLDGGSGAVTETTKEKGE